MVDAESPFTAGHSVRVGHYTDLVAAELGLSAPRRRWLHRAALLHDVGNPPMDAERTLGIMRAGVGTAIDPDCFAALERVVAS